MNPLLYILLGIILGLGLAVIFTVIAINKDNKHEDDATK
jgi:hypothetical protein